MKSLGYFFCGLVIGAIIGYFFLTPQCPPEGYVLITRAQMDSINEIAAAPPVVKHDTIVIVRERIRTDTIWIANPDTSLSWHTDSLIMSDIDVSHSFLARDVRASTWAYRPIIRQIIDSIIITRPQIIEIEKLINNNHITFYATAAIGPQITAAGITATRNKLLFGAMIDPWRGNIMVTAGYRLTK